MTKAVKDSWFEVIENTNDTKSYQLIIDGSKPPELPTFFYRRGVGWIRREKNSLGHQILYKGSLIKPYRTSDNINTTKIVPKFKKGDIVTVKEKIEVRALELRSEQIKNLYYYINKKLTILASSTFIGGEIIYSFFNIPRLQINEKYLKLWKAYNHHLIELSKFKVNDTVKVKDKEILSSYHRNKELIIKGYSSYPNNAIYYYFFDDKEELEIREDCLELVKKDIPNQIKIIIKW